jgi:hypothetical protein
MAATLVDWAHGPGKQFHGTGLTVYGELIGPKIQGNPHGLDAVEFRPFDVRDAEGRWWPRARVEAEVPGGLPWFLDTLASKIASFDESGGEPMSHGGTPAVEGFVGTPELCTLDGTRIITKLKWKDFA